MNLRESPYDGNFLFLLKAIVFYEFERIIHTLVSTMKVSHRFEVKDLRWIAHLLIDMNVNGIEAHRFMKLAAICLTKTFECDLKNKSRSSS
jgi:hypothetical protein